MRTVVGVLRGGPSSEYEISLLSGAAVLGALNQEKYEPRDVFVSRDGQWHMHGVPVTPEKALRGVDVAFNVLHGEYGESGQVQQLLNSFAVPYTGPDALASSLAFNKQHTKDALGALGIQMPHSVVVEPSRDLERVAIDLFRSFPQPSIVKPIVGGSSVGTTVADSFHSLQFGLEKALTFAHKALVEEYIPGVEASVGVIEGFRDEPSYALFPIKIIPPKEHKFYSYEAKYGGHSIEQVPGAFVDKEKRQLIDIARKAHEGLGLSHYSRSDFILSKRGIYLLEVNSAAAVGIAQESLFTKALHAVGSNLGEFVDHVIELARGQKKR